MRVVLQRVSNASVRIDGRVVGSVGAGFCLLVGFTHSDTQAQVDWMADKVAGLRLFPDAEGKMNVGLAEVGGSGLVACQLLEMRGLEVDVSPPHIPEIRAAGETPRAYVERLAREKAASVPGELVLG